jgi:hypothetical protein
MDLTTLSTTEIALIVALVVVVIAAIAFVALQRKRRTTNLKTKFGDAEYSRAVDQGGNRRTAEAKLNERTERVEALNVRPLSEGDRIRFLESWRGVQTRFVDGPAGAVTEADQLLGDVMATRGYPVSNFEQRAADISVGHPAVLENYRQAHEIALKQTRGQANTEELRQAMVHYRTLFNELVGEPIASVAGA